MNEEMSGNTSIVDVASLVSALRKRASEAETLQSKPYDSPECQGWWARSKSLVRKANERDFLKRFESVESRKPFISVGESPQKQNARLQEHQVKALQDAQHILLELALQVEAFGIPPSGPITPTAEAPGKQRRANRSRVVQIPKQNRNDEGKRFLDGAREKRSCGDILKQNHRWACAAQMYQQAMELSMKAVMILCTGQYRTNHDFGSSDIGNTLRQWAKISDRATWPNVDACFSAANRWAPIHMDSVYGYSYGKPAHAVTSEKEAQTAAEDARRCIQAAGEVARVAGK